MFLRSDAFVTHVLRRRLILHVLRSASDWIKDAAFEDSAATL